MQNLKQRPEMEKENPQLHQEQQQQQQRNIYKLARTIKKKDNSLYNALYSIYEDSVFVGEISQIWPQLPLLANLRCGLWYSPNFHSTCYFKSTDGHTNNFSFSTARLNLHVAHLAGQKGGCVIVDSTRKGKRFPDSMSKTIPIWTCVLNRAIRNYLGHLNDKTYAEREGLTVAQGSAEGEVAIDWDCSLHLPIWVSKTEKSAIEKRLEEWTDQLEATGADISYLASHLRKPLRPLWISQKTVIWLNEVPEYDSWDFTPIILVSASSSDGVVQHRSSSEFSWNYIPGAGDDEESWARGLSPKLFWKNAYDIISLGPDFCNQKVADIVERDRVYRSLRGEDAPQISVRAAKSLGHTKYLSDERKSSNNEFLDLQTEMRSCREETIITWLGSTNLAVSASQHAADVSNIDCILNCDKEPISTCLSGAEAHCHLPIVSSKLDRFSLLYNLPSALSYARSNLLKGKTILVCCQDGEDISICICLAILTSLYDNEGTFNDGKCFSQMPITKWELRRRLVYICKFATNARPSRGNLKQVYGFLNGKSDIDKGKRPEVVDATTRTMLMSING